MKSCVFYTAKGVYFTQICTIVLYQESLCQTPVNRTIDPLYWEITCTQSQYAGRSLYNHEGFMATWVEYASTGNGSSDQQQRPAQINLPYLDSTILPRWINTINTTEASHKYGRVVNRASLFHMLALSMRYMISEIQCPDQESPILPDPSPYGRRCLRR
jgi:hypothetical protein